MTLSRLAATGVLLAAACTAGAQTAARTIYIVQLADAPAATYAGAISGLAATRPALGAKLDINAPAVRAYRSYLDSQRNREVARIGGVRMLHRYDVAFNGFAAQLTDAQAAQLKTSSRVLSVTPAEIHQIDTTRTPAFLGLSTAGGLWSQTDAQSRLVKGENVIIGVIDTGAWPEDPSFGDRIGSDGRPAAYNMPGTSAYGPPPARWAGVCQTGEGFTAAMCNNKLIGARYYMAGFIAGGATLNAFEYRSPRGGGGAGGHGTHTASTAGGNENVLATANGGAAGTMSGIAPRARLAVYKACWQAATTEESGCYSSDSLRAIDDAVADGVDVINFSVGGTQTLFSNPIQIAYLNAAAAGVFVAAAAGNAGPGNQVTHISPWLMTVGASTHDRQVFAKLTMGNGASYTGASINPAVLPLAIMVLSSAIPAQGVAVADANLCRPNSLNAFRAADRIVVCDNGNIDRLAKSAEVKRAGGVGMVLINTVNENLFADIHTVPTVHLQNTDRSLVREYAAALNPAPFGSIGAAFQQPGVVAPVMASFSSRGPNKANGNILKPDITAPGVDIIAGYGDNSLTQAQHDALVLNGFTPQANAGSLQGTSMATPHVAGAAALLKQLYPTWTPAAIKSALMTATNDVKLASGAADPDRWGYGAGHLNPTPAANPGLVYDVSPADYGRFLCGQGLTPPTGIGSCTALGSIQPWNLNLASMTAVEIPGSLTLTRRVTNVTGTTTTFVSSASLAGSTVNVSPSSLTLAPGASANFNVTLTRTSADVNAWTFGSLSWRDNSHTVRSPLSARFVSLIAPAQLNGTRPSGPSFRSFDVTPAFSGAMRVSTAGLLPATLSTGTVTENASRCFNFTVTAGALAARFQLFNTDTAGGADTDLDLAVYSGPNGTGSQLGASTSETSDELVSLVAPAAGNYSACVVGFNTPSSGAAFTLSRWVLYPGATSNLQATGPRSVNAREPAPIQVRWSVDAGSRYLGNLAYVDGTGAPVGSTLLFVDTR